MNKSTQFGLYAILTNPLKGYEYLAKVLVEHKVKYIQLRMKDCPVTDVHAMSEKIRKITEGSSSLFIVNDYPEIARSVGADGVHIGQTDMLIEQVRAIIGKNAIIGLSTHNPSQTKNACLHTPEYIGVGPVYPTPTKKCADPVIGLEIMKQMLSVATVPAVAIGGIDLSNLRHVLENGAKNFCMVRQLTQSENPHQVLKDTAKLYEEFYPGIMKI